MAFVTFVAGDVYDVESQVFPYVPKAGYTPVAGHFVINDTTIASGIDLVAADENPMGMVIKFENGIASVLRLLPGTRIIFPKAGAVVKGDKITGDATSGTLNTTIERSPLKAAVGGVGLVIAEGAETAHGVGFAIAEF